MKVNMLKSNISMANSELSSSGGTIYGTLILSRNPIESLEASTRQYVENKLNNLNANNFTSGIIPISVLPGFTGDLISNNGSNNFILNNTNVTPGSYTKVTVNNKGRITIGENLINNDIPDGISFNKIQNKPTTLAGYGITNAINKSGGTLTGFLIINNSPIQPNHIANKQYVDNILSNSSSSGLAVGDIIRRPISTTPPGFLRCNGAKISKTTYANLYSAIGDTYTFDSHPGNGRPWQQQYEINTEQSGNITGWTTGPSLPEPLADSSAIVTKNRVYLLGGHNDNGFTSTVYTAPINNDGTLGTWTTGTSLPGPLANSSAIVTKNRVYLLGGSNVYTAPINNDGTLGTWTTGTSLPVPLENSRAIVTKNRVYLLGGYNTNNVYTALINNDGVLGTWTTGHSLPFPINDIQIIVIKNKVYLLGYFDVSYWYSFNYLSPILSASINNNGTLNTWSIDSFPPLNFYSFQVIVTKNRIYILGGSNNHYDSNTYMAPINNDGTLGTWTTGPSLPGPLNSSQAIITKNRVYLLGGYDNNGFTSTVYTAPILGGLNDYSSYYDSTYIHTNPNNFGLPDMTNDLDSFSFIKY